MNPSMACGAKRNQVLLGIVAGLAAKFLVVDLEVRHRATQLALPPVTMEHLSAELFVQSGVKPQTRPLRSDTIHDALSAKWSRNVFLSSPGKNLKKRRIDCRSTCELPLSRLAP